MNYKFASCNDYLKRSCFKYQRDFRTLTGKQTHQKYRISAFYPHSIFFCIQILLWIINDYFFTINVSQSSDRCHFREFLDLNHVLDGEGFGDKKLRVLKLKKYTY